VFAVLFVSLLKVGGMCFSKASDIEPTSQDLFQVKFGVRIYPIFIFVVLYSASPWQTCVNL